MKKSITCCLLLLICFGQFGCKKFLDVVPIEKLSGNQYWKSKVDVEAFVNDIYAQMWAKMTSTSFMAATGELRCGEIKPTIGGRYNTTDAGRRVVYNSFAINDLKTVLDITKAWYSANDGNKNMNFASITKWNEFYTAIQGANILYDQIQKGVPGLSAEDTKAYLAEAAYIRCLNYFLMVRLYGDVAYYTDAYHATPIARENFVSVLNKCIDDLKAVKDNLPFKLQDPAFYGVRASKGGIIALLMNMNMWNAGFDATNKTKYYQETADLGDELIKSNQFQLVPIGQFPNVMLGESSEALVELDQSVNYGIVTPAAPAPPTTFAYFGEMVLAFPNKLVTNNINSHAYFKSTYLAKIYTDFNDKRRSLWFNNMFSDDGNFEMLKFAGSVSPNGYPDWALVLFRYGDAILLRAEALAELGLDNEATDLLNMVRLRAEAATYPEPINALPLKDAIFMERSKELIGEGYRYFDLVRTRRITDANWCLNPLSSGQFDAGAWTWPIDISALNRNPFMTLNAYWQ